MSQRGLAVVQVGIAFIASSMSNRNIGREVRNIGREVVYIVIHPSTNPAVAITKDTA